MNCIIFGQYNKVHSYTKRCAVTMDIFGNGKNIKMLLLVYTSYVYMCIGLLVQMSLCIIFVYTCNTKPH